MKVGDRVQLHPATDRWMMGDRYGVVTDHRVLVVGRSTRAEAHNEYKVKLDKSEKTLWFNEKDVRPVE